MSGDVVAGLDMSSHYPAKFVNRRLPFRALFFVPGDDRAAARPAIHEKKAATSAAFKSMIGGSQ
jgi:hypothetical protein